MTMSELRAQVINLLQDAWELGYECGAKDISSARTVTLDAMTDADFAERGLVRLPVDADGVTWTGTEHEYSCQRFDGTWKNKPLVALAYDAKKGKWTCLESYSGNDAASCRHAPTVEDALREFAYGLGVPVADSYVAAAATKLRLADDGKEQ